MKIAKSSTILVMSAALSLPAVAQVNVGLARHGNAQGTVELPAWALARRSAAA